MWAEHRPAWALYARFGTQVRVGAAGVAGFDYPAILGCAERFGVDASEEAFAGLQLVEGWMLDRQEDERRRMEEQQRRASGRR